MHRRNSSFNFENPGWVPSLPFLFLSGLNQATEPYRRCVWINLLWFWARDLLVYKFVMPHPHCECWIVELVDGINWKRSTLFALILFSFSSGGFFWIFKYFIQLCFICRPSDTTVPVNAGIEPRTVATPALTARRSKHLARSRPHSVRSHPHSARSHPQFR